MQLLALGLAGVAGVGPATASADVGSWSLTTVDNQPPFFDAARSAAVTCPSTSFCIALGQAGRAETTTNPTGPSTAWQAEKIDTAALQAVSCASSTLCVAVDASGGIVASSNPAGGDQAWHTVATDAGGTPIDAVSCSPTGLCVAVGNAGNALASTNPATSGSWTTSNIDGATAVDGISCPTASFCAAVDVSGNVVTSSDPGIASPSWSTHVIDSGHSLLSISCVDTSLCVAGDNVGNAVTSTDPASSTPTWTLHAIDIANVGLTGISCPSTSLCVISDFGGRVLWSTNPTGTSPGTFTVAAIDSTTLYGLACPAESLCVAVDSMGNALSTTTPTGAAGAWAKVGIEGTTRLDQGTCVTTTFCVVPDRLGRIVTSTDPTGGSSAWHAATVDGTHQIFDVSCPTESLCVGSDDAGDVVTSTTPLTGPWTVTNIDSNRTIHGISCPTEALCVAVDTSGGMLWSTNPTGGAGSWSTRVVIDTPSNPGFNLFRIDCPTIGLCVAVDQSGNAVTSTDPTGGADKWTVTTGVDGTNAIFSLQCASASLCIAGDQQGNVVTTTNPTGPASDWHVASIDSGDALFGVACPSATLCVAADNAGALLHSSNPGGGVATWSFITQLAEDHGFLGLMCPSATLCVAPGFHSDIAVGTGTAADVVTGSATGITGMTATLNGTVNPQGSNVTDCHFDYGTSSNPYGSTAPCAQAVGSGTGVVAVSADVTGLTPNTTYHFRLVAAGGGGTVDGTDATFPTPAVVPELSTSAPSNLAPTSATLNGQVNPHNSTIADCQFDYGTGGPPYDFSVPCAEAVGGGNGDVSVSAALSGLQANMVYHFSLEATNGAGPASTPDATFSTTAIDTVITGGPDGPTSNSAPSFSFTADPADGATFVCSVDHASPSPCSSPLTTGHLADGEHGITVRASTPGGLQDPTPAQRSFFVDTVAPTTTVAFAPEPGAVSSQIGSGNSFSGPVQVTVSASDPDPGSGVAQTRCAVDPATVPHSFADLPAGCASVVQGVGSHTLYLASSDNAANTEAPTAHTVTIVPTPDTTITGGPDGPTWDSGPAFSFSSSIAGSTFRCRIDGGPFNGFNACTSPFLSPALASGEHTFEVEAVSPAGVTDPTPASRAFSVNAPQSQSRECHISPFLALTPFSNQPAGCEIVSPGVTCQSDDVCVPIDAICPMGALCTLTMRTSFDNADQNADWEIDAQPTATSPAGRISLAGPESGSCIEQRASPPHCEATDTVTILGEEDRFDYQCDAADFNSDRGTTHGPDSARHLDCFASLSIKPGPPLATTTQGLDLQIFAPSPGSFRVAPGGGPSHATRATAAAHAKPLFKPIGASVRRAGVIELTLHLSAAAARTYKRHHKLTLRVRETFTPIDGSAIIANRTLTLTPPAETLGQRCASRRPRNTKLCRRLLSHHTGDGRSKAPAV